METHMSIRVRSSTADDIPRRNRARPGGKGTLNLSSGKACVRLSKNGKIKKN